MRTEVRVRRWVVAFVLAIAGCRHNPQYCGQSDCAPDGPPIPIDAVQNCQTGAECPEETPLCEPIEGDLTCVECTAANTTLCIGPQPVCRDNACQACETHADCMATSGVCLPDGSCAVESDVAYVVAGGGNGPDCTKTMPCNTVAAGLGKLRKVVKLTGRFSGKVTLNRDVIVVGDSQAATELNVTGLNVQVVVVTAGKVAISDLTIRDAYSSEGIYLNGTDATLTLKRVTVTFNNAFGINAEAGMLVMDRCKVYDNVNGLWLHGAAFDISNSLFTINGGPPGNTHGVKIETASLSRPHRFELNTIARNIGTGLICNAGIELANNISFANDTQVSGSCTHVTSITDADPKFANTDDYHLAADSPAIDKATPPNPRPDPDADYDGRPRPNGGGYDIGAYER